MAKLKSQLRAARDQNARLFNELQARTRDLSESLQQQIATADILKVISDSRGKIEPVFDKILGSARQLCDARFGHLLLFDGETWRAEALHNVPEAYASFWNNAPVVAEPETNLGRVQRSGKPDQVADLRLASGYLARSPLGVATVELGGARTLLTVPLLKEGKVIGGIAFYRTEVRPFDARQIELLASFADQAVIAIENARLFNETQEALERQTATAEILKVIAASPSDVQPVFEAIAERSNQLMGGLSTAVYSIVDDVMHLMAFTRTRPEADAALRASFPRPLSDAPWADQARRGEVVEIPDADAEFADQPALLQMARLRGFRSVLFVPLLRDGATIGIIGVTRPEAGTFAARHVQLLQTFADQAVIAVGNVRLFDEVQARTDDLRESLTYQTAISNVLNVISRSPSDIQPVLDTIAETAQQLCQSEHAAIFRLDGDRYRLVASRDVRAERTEFLRANPIVPNRGSTVGRVALERRPVHIMDALADSEYKLSMVGHGGRTILGVPLLRDGIAIGVIVLTRGVVRPFAERQIELVSTFADQALIAIENVRLFDEVQAKTRDLTESLEQQTATSEVLEVISSSPGELEPVFRKMLENATRVCGASFGTMNLWDGEKYNLAADYNVPPAFSEFRQRTPIRPHPGTTLEIVARTHEFAQVHDIKETPAYRAGVPNVVAMVEIAGARTLLVVPMLKEDELIGSITIFRKEVRPFNDKQIALVENFTKQAVIAIENTRLLRELRQRTDDLSESLEQQTATSEVLQVISSTPGDLEPVFKTMLENATRVCGANFGLMNLYEDGRFRSVASYNVPPAYTESLATRPAFQPHPQSALGTVARTRQVVHIADIRDLPAYREGDPSVTAIADRAGARSYFVVPMLKENELIGAITIYRQEVKPFAEKQTEVVSNFASQAVIAIENARLLNELRERTKELSLSLDDLRTAQDRLVQTEKLASLGQLTAGIAHEIKNPLNFVNNFSALSAELTDELNDVLKPAALTDKIRGEVDELTKTLKDNLEKVVQHGKRADSIVKNMLLHSREGSGELRPADINALVDESLNLAYHGARAEKAGFNITLQRDFDADAGAAELFPQEITRAFLNLISNGFYAANRRKAENGDAGFEPTLRASTKNLGSTVEIRIRDNGTGIPPEVKEKMFNPFFTTKPAGEGTGLGLSMSHDIIVKQHGGTIDVATEPGQFTELTIVLPRTANSPGKMRGKT